jgi:hypothetical protein
MSFELEITHNSYESVPSKMEMSARGRQKKRKLRAF